MTSISSIHTAEQLLAAGDIGRCELVRGELTMMSPAGANHGRIAMRISSIIDQHVTTRKLGEVFAAETGFILGRNPDTVRAPDVAFVVFDRLHLVLPRGYFPGAPDLAVEVLSPDDTASEVLAKVEDWLSGGTREVWIADPQRKTVAVHRQDEPMRVFGPAEMLTSESLLPGFEMNLRELFG